MRAERRVRLAHWLVEIFAAANLAFLAVDIYFAHSVNAFANSLEWVPVVFSATAPLLLVPGVLGRSYQRGAPRVIGYVVGGLSIAVGLVGMVLHLESHFFSDLTLKSLVYTAPFVAPLSYVGVGLLLVLNRMEKPGSPRWAEWVVFLALGGFAGNLGLSLLDHAQNGFFEPAEWIGVVAAAFGVSFLFVVVVRPAEPALLRATLGLMVLEVGVGLLGFGLHLGASVGSPSDTLFEKIVYGAPVFAPLLFPNLALLAMLGLWCMPGEAHAGSTGNLAEADASS